MILGLLVATGTAMAVMGLRRRRTTGANDRAVPAPGVEASLDPDFEAEVDAVDRDLALSAAASVAAGAAFVATPALTLVAVPLLAVPLVTLGRISVADYRRDGRLSLGGLQSIGGVAAIALGHVGLCAIGTTAFIGGKRLQLATRRRTRDALVGAFGDWVETVWVLREGTEVEVGLADVERGDLVVVAAGLPIPCDGVLLEGQVVVDQRRLTGESTPVDRMPGDPLSAATLAVAGRGLLRVERAGRETLAARLAAMVEATESYEQTIDSEIEAMANGTVAPTAVMTGLGALRGGVMGGLAGMWSNCIEVAWLTAPLASLASTQAAARAGVLVKDGRSLELVRRVDTVVLDKTGTLTLDHLELADLHTEPGVERGRLLALAAAAEGRQQHPIAQALVAAADAEGVERLTLDDDVAYDVGLGLTARVDGRAVVLGSRRLVERAGIEIGVEAAGFVARAATRGRGVVLLAVDGRLAGAFALAPVVRPEARRIVDTLRARGLAVEILTGDDPEPTRALAAQLGIDAWRASMLPEDKSEHIQALVAAGRRVCFVGDGVNDALAMRHAQVSVSMTGASAIALDSAQVILRDGSLRRLGDLFDLGDQHGRAGERIAVAAAAPTIASIGGVLFAGLGPASAIGFYGVGLAAGLTVAAGQGRWRPAADEAPTTDG